ncbi:MAG TPA: hypothetical protein VLF43_04895 [Candidatus Saccharimonadales bacterium]|nr:hypothetical protein [Candidatus Saccharimonadales bacterium]
MKKAFVNPIRLLTVAGANVATMPLFARATESWWTASAQLTGMCLGFAISASLDKPLESATKARTRAATIAGGIALGVNVVDAVVSARTGVKLSEGLPLFELYARGVSVGTTALAAGMAYSEWPVPVQSEANRPAA